VFHISSILYCIFILCIIVTNLALWLQDLNKLLTYLLTYYLRFKPLTALNRYLFTSPTHGTHLSTSFRAYFDMGHLVFGMFFLGFILVGIFMNDFARLCYRLHCHHSRYLVPTPHTLLRLYRPMHFFIFFIINLLHCSVQQTKHDYTLQYLSDTVHLQDVEDPTSRAYSSFPSSLY